MRSQLHSENPLLDFWESTRLSADEALDPPEPERPDAATAADQALRVVLADALGRGCGQRPGTVLAKDGTFVQARTTPSAGALYPFEVLVSLGPGGTTYLYEIDAGRLSPLASGPPVPPDELAAGAGIGGRGGAVPRAVVVFAARPWRSMAKYGVRGYRYTFLDTGHAASNLALALRDAGLSATVHLRFRRQWLAHALGLAGTCREPQAVVTVTGTPEPPTRDADAARPVWLDRGQARLDPPDDAERRNFATLRGISLSYGPATPPWPGQATSLSEARHGGRAAGPGGPGGPAPVWLPRRKAGPGDRAELMARRESAKGFLPDPIPLARLAALLDGVNGGLDADFADPELGVAVRIVARAVEGLAPGAHAYAPSGHMLLPMGEGEVAEADVLETCQRQAGLRHAAALVLLHAPVPEVLREHGRGGLAELHFHAAHVAQRMCLNATAAGLGLTCVGGFDEAHGARLGRLSRDEEIVYLLAVGVPDPAARKTDREAVAYSHGRTVVDAGGPPVRTGGAAAGEVDVAC
ncbi:nitroreductase family protein [Actinoallomurus sp. NPDC050550]|uniref:nitroreductase family protein n=1 Tax=Actinoallomurus sp. NPDC050550 TaxID=3154937 RepID=UPI00340941F5